MTYNILTFDRWATGAAKTSCLLSATILRATCTTAFKEADNDPKIGLMYWAWHKSTQGDSGTVASGYLDILRRTAPGV